MKEINLKESVQELDNLFAPKEEVNSHQISIDEYISEQNANSEKSISDSEIPSEEHVCETIGFPNEFVDSNNGDCTLNLIKSIGDKLHNIAILLNEIVEDLNNIAK